MGLPAHKAAFTADDYLDWENTRLERHKCLDGEVFVMAVRKTGASQCQ